MILADIIKRRRAFLGLTQEDLAQMSEIGIATIKLIESNKGNPSLSTVGKIMDVLGMEIIYSIKKTV